MHSSVREGAVFRLLVVVGPEASDLGPILRRQFLQCEGEKALLVHVQMASLVLDEMLGHGVKGLS